MGKIMGRGPGLNVLQKSSKDPCGMCLKGIGANSIFCDDCSSWVHKKCSTIPGPLKPGPHLNIKTVLSTYGDFHVKDKTAARTSYL